MKRQGLIVTIRKLRTLARELEKEGMEVPSTDYAEVLDRRWQVNIINEKGLSDTWELEE